MKTQKTQSRLWKQTRFSSKCPQGMLILISIRNCLPGIPVVFIPGLQIHFIPRFSIISRGRCTPIMEYTWLHSKSHRCSENRGCRRQKARLRAKRAAMLGNHPLLVYCHPCIVISKWPDSSTVTVNLINSWCKTYTKSGHRSALEGCIEQIEDAAACRIKPLLQKFCFDPFI